MNITRLLGDWMDSSKFDSFGVEFLNPSLIPSAYGCKTSL